MTTQFGASAVLDIGYRAHTKADGTAVNASAAALHNDAAVGAGAVDLALALPAAGYLELDSREGINIFATVASGDIEDTDTIEGFIAYAMME